MNTIQKKILRVQRLRSLQQGKLNSMVEQLAVIESQLDCQFQQLTRLNMQLENGATLWGNDSVKRHSQRVIWTDHLQRRIDETKRAINETESQREEMRRAVLEQRAKVQGWESLLDRFIAARNREQQSREFLVADDRYLNGRLGRSQI